MPICMHFIHMCTCILFAHSNTVISELHVVLLGMAVCLCDRCMSPTFGTFSHFRRLGGQYCLEFFFIFSGVGVGLI